MKRIFAIVLALMLALSLSVPALAANEPEFAGLTLPKPETPDHFIYYPGEGEEGSDALSVYATVDPTVAALAQEYWVNSERFCEERGLSSFHIALQFDVSLDTEDNWQHTTQWDTQAEIGTGATGYTYARLEGSLVETVELFWLSNHAGQGTATFEAFQDAIISKEHTDGEFQWETYYFDQENHSLHFRCRYILVWYINGDDQAYSNVGPWSDCAVFGKGSTQIVPNKPESYEAPVISQLEIHPQDEDTDVSCLTYMQDTPESLWDAEVYYSMSDDGGFQGLETQISINGGEWQTVETDSSAGNLCLKNGLRTVTGTDKLTFDKTQTVKLRVRVLGTEGPSEWSNELTAAPEQTQNETPDNTDNNQNSKSNFPWLWIIIPTAIILLAAVIILIIIKKKRK